MNKNNTCGGSLLGTFKNYLLSKGFSIETTQSYHRGVLQYIVWTETERIESELSTYNQVISYVQYLKNRGLQQQSIQQSINSLNHYFNWIIQRGLRGDNPTSNIIIRGIKKRKLHHVLSKQALEQLYRDFKEVESERPAKPGRTERSLWARKRNEVIVGLLVYQGLNSKELGRLKVTDLQLREGKIFIQGCRKSNERYLQLQAHQILDMMEYQLRTREDILKQTGKQTDLLFTSFGKGTKFHNIIHKLLPQLKRLNRTIESVNQIRASVITGWLKNHNLRQVQYMAGHRWVSSTEAYLVNDLEDLQEDIGKYHPIGYAEYMEQDL